MATVHPLDHMRGRPLFLEMPGSVAMPEEARVPLVWGVGVIFIPEHLHVRAHAVTSLPWGYTGRAAVAGEAAGKWEVESLWPTAPSTGETQERARVRQTLLDSISTGFSGPSPLWPQRSLHWQFPGNCFWLRPLASRGPAQRLGHKQPAFSGERTASLQTQEWLDPHSFAGQGHISSPGARFIL